MTDYTVRWKIIEPLGEGGQGKVFRVLDSHQINLEESVLPNLVKSVQVLNSAQPAEEFRRYGEMLRKAVIDLVRAEDAQYHGALKVLHKPENARDSDLADVRIKREIEAMARTSHPNLLAVLEADPESGWFVSRFYSLGTLAKNPDRFAGDFPGALRAFRSLVDGVARLHRDGMVHRDIKPQNIFLDSSGRLVLGDFGLVLFTDEQHTRISATVENVGSRDWMPAWAMGMRVEDLKPSFDVFSLGKVLWSMVSGRPILRLWYFNRPQFDLERLYPKSRFIRLANPLLGKCVVEDAENCLPDASALLGEVDEVLSQLDHDGEPLDTGIPRRCRVCGLGEYRMLIDRNGTQLGNFGIRPAGAQTFRVFVCTDCGNVQIFSFSDHEHLPSAWEH